MNHSSVRFAEPLERPTACVKVEVSEGDKLVIEEALKLAALTFRTTESGALVRLCKDFSNQFVL